MDDVFVQVQHGGCGAIYAPAAELKNLVVELKHDAITYRVDESWIAQAQVDRSQQEFEDQEALDKQREADRRNKAEEQQKELREQYGKPAEVAAAAITNDVKVYLEKGGKDPEVAGAYPVFTKWYSSRLSDHWELLSSNSELFDSGHVTWKERTLEAVFGKVTIKLKNAVLGEYVDGCFLFGHVIDEEFGVYRDPIGLPCAESGAFASWKSGHSFQSQWVVQ